MQAYPLVDHLVQPSILVYDAKTGNQNLLKDEEILPYRQPYPDRVAYAVIRVREGVLVFFEDHMTRFKRSLEYIGGQFVDRDFYLNFIQTYFNQTNKSSGNIRLVATPKECIVHWTEDYYPSATQQKEGVHVGVLEWERKDPSIKLIQADYKAAVKAKFDQSKADPYFELLLVNPLDQILEGSRSNVFFLKDNAVITTPDAFILKGITRKYVLQAIEQTGFVLKEDLVNRRDVMDGYYDAAFITASTIDILLVKSVEDFVFSPHKSVGVHRIVDGYQKLIKKYIKEHKNGGLSHE